VTQERHIGEEAELYALGYLSDDERAALEAHARGCLQCLRRVGEAEETLLALERQTVAPAPSAALGTLRLRRRNLQAWWLAPALAAAFVLGMLVPRGQAPQNPALIAIATSHFNHSQFIGPHGPRAKVLYARDHTWYYVVVTGGRSYEVYGVRVGVATPLGSTRVEGDSGQLFVRSSSRFDRIELRDRGQTIESAAIR
jgi:hypothetical protein